MIIKTTQSINNAFIVDAVNKKISDNVRLQRLQDYFEGKHDILLRHYSDPTKPNNRIVVNFCKKISDFLTGFLVGVPVRYEAPQILLDSLEYSDEADVTQAIVQSMNVMGFGCELLYTDADGIPRFASIDPRESIFITDDSIEGVMTAYIRLYPNADNPDVYNVTVYNAENYTEYRLSRAVSELKAIGEPVPHFFDDVPAIMYPNNPEHTGSFEGVISLQNALNVVMSDEVNDFESFVDAYLCLSGLQGTQSEDIAKMKQDRLLLLDENSDAKWLIKNVNNDHIKELKANLVSKIHELGCVPDIENLGSFGSSGVALRFKMLHTELMAAKQERTLHRGLQRRLELLYNILRMSDASIGTFTDVNIIFTRNYIMLSDENMNNKRIDLSLVGKGILSKETFLRQYKGMTPEEAREELNAVAVEVNSGVYSPADFDPFTDDIRKVFEQ